jgi:radical SAM enzyme (TIGR04100 family)
METEQNQRGICMSLQEEIGTVFYSYGDGLYANITNRCPCRCEFCVRNETSGLGSAASLWLKREPSAAEIRTMFDAWDPAPFRELVFCGYGEPTERLEDLLDAAAYVKEKSGLQIRINTNGLSDLIHGKDTAPMLEGLVDSVSISLNQCTAQKYDELCHPKFGPASYEALLNYTRRVQQYVPHVAMSVVGVIPREDIERCRAIAAGFGIGLRVR